MVQRLSIEEFGTLFNQFEHTAFRLEVQPEYVVESELEQLTRFHSGQPLNPPDEPSYAEWLDYVANQAALGRRISRVRVQPDPPTSYQQWERWAGRWNISAGEEIRYVTPDTAKAAGLGLDYDWWLFDSQRLFIMDFDTQGRLLGGDIITDPAIVVQHCAWRDVAVHYSAPDQGVPATT